MVFEWAMNEEEEEEAETMMWSRNRKRRCQERLSRWQIVNMMNLSQPKAKIKNKTRARTRTRTKNISKKTQKKSLISRKAKNPLTKTTPNCITIS